MFTQLAMNGITVTSCLCSSSMPLSNLSKHSRSLRISTAMRHADCTSSNVSQCSESASFELVCSSSQTSFRPVRACQCVWGVCMYVWVCVCVREEEGDRVCF